jgi:ATP-dependent DNA helicase DinG
MHARLVVGAGVMDKLWSECVGAILTSATLGAKDTESILRRNIGFPEGARVRRMPHVFDYQRRAKLIVPHMKSSPSDQARHNHEVAQYLNSALMQDGGSLVLFNSRMQFEGTIKHLSAAVMDLALLQYSAPMPELLRRHRANGDEGGRSAILGLASFAEGVDLPGAYCVRVIINKLGFLPPRTPIMQTMEEWYQKMEGAQVFQQVSLPLAILRLQQCSGRLLRSENDYGEVVLLDSRIKSKYRAYGQTMLDALPPFDQHIS